MSDESRQPIPDRRRMLRGAGLAGAGLVAAAIAAEQIAHPTPAQAGTDGDVVLGQSNITGGLTLIDNTANNGIAFQGNASGSSSYGLVGGSDSGTGVFGNSGGEGTGVFGSSTSGTGVYGLSLNSTGTRGGSSQGNGVDGSSGTGNGVNGRSGVGNGVNGTSTSGVGVAGSSHSHWGVSAASDSDTALQAQSKGGIGVVGVGTASGVYGQSGATDGFALTRDGVRGFTDSATASGVRGENVGGGAGVSGSGHVGVLAQANGAGATALDVQGPAMFSRSGLLTIPAGAAAVTKAHVALTAGSLVLVTLQQNLPGIYVASAVPNAAAGSFTVHLNKAAPKAAKVAWFIVN